MVKKGWSKEDEANLFWFLATAYLADCMGLLDEEKAAKLASFEAAAGYPNRMSLIWLGARWCGWAKKNARNVIAQLNLGCRARRSTEPQPLQPRPGAGDRPDRSCRTPPTARFGLA